MSAAKKKASQQPEIEKLKQELAALQTTEKVVRGNAEAAALLLDNATKELKAVKEELNQYKMINAADLAPFVGMPKDMAEIFLEIWEERKRQDAKWGEQNHPDGTGPEFKVLADAARDACEKAFKEGKGTWKHILTEEFMEAMAESDETKLTTELIQTKAVATAWLQNIRRRHRGEKAEGQNQAHG